MSTTPSTNGIKVVGTDDMLLELSKRKWRYIFLLLFCGGVSFWLLKYRIFTYSSSASFYMSESSAGTNVGQNQEFRMPEVLHSNEQYNRAYQLINSSKIHEHLIRKFNLLKHYGIDTTREFYFEEAIAVLSSRIQVKKSPFNMISVSVSDAHRYLAADIANEIVVYLDQMNKNLLINSMKQRLGVYETLVKNTQNDNSIRTALFNKQLADLNLLLSRLEKQSTNSMGVLELQSRLSQLIASMERSTDDLMRMKVFYSLALQSVQEKNLPSVIIVQKARPSHQSLGWQSLTISFLIMLLVLTGIIYSVYLKLRYKNYFQVLLANGKSNIEHKFQEKVNQ